MTREMARLLISPTNAWPRLRQDYDHHPFAFLVQDYDHHPFAFLV
ncbi:hypothetical protein MNU22_31385, partial [Pseudomonas aeruginosa]|nr:hypothetical protein [Pseudomonas aeruginosa]